VRVLTPALTDHEVATFLESARRITAALKGEPLPALHRSAGGKR
jgi:hypothetical protein